MQTTVFKWRMTGCEWCICLKKRKHATMMIFKTVSNLNFLYIFE